MCSCLPGSICFEWMKGVPAAFVTLIIGGIATWIAYNQFRVAKAKLKLDLFEKRYHIFHETWVILSGVVGKGTRDESYGLGTPFNNFLPQAVFLFGEDISEYLDIASTNWAELHGLERESDDQNAARIKNIARRSELEKWFFNQAEQRVKEKFGSYLNFEGWK